MTTTMNKTISKRTITTLLNKLSKDIPYIKTTNEVADLVNKIIPDAELCVIEYTEYGEDMQYIMSFQIAGEYTGNITIRDFRKADIDFKRLLSQECIELFITRTRDSFEILFQVRFKYINTWGEELSTMFDIKSGIVPIDLSIRKDEVTLLIEDINALSSGTVASLIANENIGEASSMCSVIDEVQKRFLSYTIDTINTTLQIPEDWDDAWFKFKTNNDIKALLYELGLDESKVEPCYDLQLSCNEKINGLRTKINYILKSDISDVKVLSLSDDILKSLTVYYALDKVIYHCGKNNVKAANKIFNKVIPSIENDEYDREFYLEYGEKGLNLFK